MYAKPVPSSNTSSNEVVKGKVTEAKASSGCHIAVYHGIK
tara:strand:- start:3204 stop:3323 length:120 start_codon:yes stop_codon:yes gene_type:complete